MSDFVQTTKWSESIVSVLVCDESAITNTCETVDKVMYRSSKLVTLSASGFNPAAVLQAVVGEGRAGAERPVK